MNSRLLELIKNKFRENKDQIEPDLAKMPERIGSYKVIIQYEPPQGLSPSEVGFLYYRKFYNTNLDAMLYDWINRGYITIKDSENDKIIVKLKELDSNKKYEQKCWNLLFPILKSSEHVTMHFHNNCFNIDYRNIGKEIANYCKEKGWIDLISERDNFLGKIPVPISLFKPISSVIIFCIISIICIFCGFIRNAIAGHIDSEFNYIIVGFYGLFFLIFVCNTCSGIYNLVYVFSHKKSITINLSDQGEKLLAHIYGYKYFLEQCEEKQYIKIMEENPKFLDKTLPYIIALRLNDCFLKEQSILNLENANITTISE